MDHRHLNFLTFNVRSIVDSSRQIDLLHTLSYNKIDVGFIQECHLRKNQKVRLKGYNFLYDNSPLGVAIAIKDSIAYNSVQINDTGFQVKFIEIEFNMENTQKKFLIGSIYIPCNFAASKIYTGLDKILQIAGTFDGFIMGGDLNARNPNWGDPLENCNGKILHNWLLDHCLDVVRICDNTPSYPNGPSYLDHFLLSPNFMNMGIPNFQTSSCPTFSDHFPIKLELKLEPGHITLKTPRCFTSYKNTNWPQFRRDLEISSLSITPSENVNLQNYEIDVLINEFNSNLTYIHNAHSEKIEQTYSKIPISENIKKIFKTKYRWQRDLKKIFHRTGNRLSPEYNLISKQIQLLKTIIKELVNLEQAKKFNEKLEKIKPGPTAFKQVYQIIGKKNSPFCKQILVNNHTVTNDTEISEHFRNFFSNVYREVTPEIPVEDLDIRIPSCVNAVPSKIYSFDNIFPSLDNNDDYHFTNVDSLKGIIKNMNNKKSSGFDGISNFLIKKFPTQHYVFSP